MNKIILLATFILLFAQIIEAQIKRQYQNEKYTEQTVVVKEEKSISDYDILNSQFNIDDFAVDEEIRITTETLPERSNKVTEQKNNHVPEAPEELAPEDIMSSGEEATKPVVQSSSVEQKSKPKLRNPRFKKQKRKRVKNYKKKCYRF